VRRLTLAVLTFGVLALASPRDGLAQCYTARAGSPYDFSPASGTLYQTDFSSDALGEFPAGLEFRSGAMEVAEWQGRRALKASAPSALVIPLLAPLPERFSVELGVVNRNTKQVGAETVEIYGGRSANTAQTHTRVIYGPIRWEVSGGGASAGTQFDSDDADVCVGQETTIRVLADGPKLKVYADERRLVSVPNAKFLRSNGLAITLAGRDDTENAVYLTSIRVSGASAPGAPVAAAVTQASPTTGTAGTLSPATTGGATTATTTAAPVGTVSATTATPTSTATVTRPPDALATEGVTHVSTSDPTAVHATGFKAISGYGNIQLEWTAAPNAVGYRIHRIGWDPTAQRYVNEHDAIFPTPTAPSSEKDLIAGTTFTDLSVKPGQQYVYTLSTYFLGRIGYYFAEPATSPKVTAVPRNPESLAWLPPAAERKTAPALVELTIGTERLDTLGTGQFGGLMLSDPYTPLTIKWAPKRGALGYVIYWHRITYALTTFVAPTCKPWETKSGYWATDFVPQHEPLVAGTTAKYRLGRLGETLMCFAIFAVYPEKLENGTPTTAYFWTRAPSYVINEDHLWSSIHSDPLLVAVRRDGAKYVRAYPTFEGSYPGAAVP